MLTTDVLQQFNTQFYERVAVLSSSINYFRWVLGQEEPLIFHHLRHQLTHPYAIKPVPRAPTPIRPIHNPMPEIIDTAAALRHDSQRGFSGNQNAVLTKNERVPDEVVERSNSFKCLYSNRVHGARG